MSDDTNSTANNNNEQHSDFSEQDKELANKAKQEYDGGQFDGLFIKNCFFSKIFFFFSLFENITKTP